VYLFESYHLITICEIEKGGGYHCALAVEVEVLGLVSRLEVHDEESRDPELASTIPVASVCAAEVVVSETKAGEESVLTPRLDGLAARAEGRKGEEMARMAMKRVVEKVILDCMILKK